MDQKQKFIIIGLAVFSLVCLFLFFQTTSQKQALLRESQDLKTENTTLLNKVGKLETDLRGNQGRIDSLKAERDKVARDLNDLQGKYESVAKTRDELIEKVKAQNQRQQEQAAQAQQQQQQPAQAPVDSDGYWGGILKAKTELELQLAQIRVDLRTTQIKNEALFREKNVLEQDITSLRNEKQDLIRQLDYNQKILDSISQEVVRERNDKVAIKDNIKTVKAQNNVLSQQLKSVSTRKIALDQKVQTLQEGKNSVERRLTEMETMLADKISQVESLKNELEAIRTGKPVPVAQKKSGSVELPAIVVKSYGKEEESFSGRILAVNADNNFVVTDLGASSGVKVGDEFGVYRHGNPIGAIAVIQLRDNISACDIKKMNTAFKIGDNVK